MIRVWCGEVPVQLIAGTLPVLARHRGAGAAAADQPVHALAPHQPVDGVLADPGGPVPGQSGRHLPPAEEHLRFLPPLRVAFVEAAKHRNEGGVIGGPVRRRTGLPRPIRPRSDRDALHAQDVAGELDLSGLPPLSLR